MQVQFKYIEENLKKVIENTNSIMYIKPYEINKQKALFAVVKESEGVYKRVQLTESLHKAFFPIEPLCYLVNGPLYFHLKNYIGFDNHMALNLDNLNGFSTKQLSGKFFNTAIFSTFNDGSAAFIKRVNLRAFNKKGGIKAYNDLLKICKDTERKAEEYYPICFPENSNTLVIPELQKNNVKKLTLN